MPGRRLLAHPAIITAVLLLQFIPLLLLPASAYNPKGQEWWLPALLAVMVLAGDLQVLVRRQDAGWPWHLISFAQGFNIISRLMLVWSHAAIQTGKTTTLNTEYIGLSFAAMVLSALVLWFAEQPDVRSGLVQHA